MECAWTFMTISAGLLLSIACATLIEELFIGGLFRIFFAPRRPRQTSTSWTGPSPAKPQNKHTKQLNQ